MAKIEIWALLLAAALTTAIVMYASVLASALVPTREEGWGPDSIVLMDSAAVAGSAKAFRFRYDTGVYGYSIAMASLGVPSYHHALIESDYIRGIEWRSPDTLRVRLRRNSYYLLPNSRRVHLSIVVDSLR